MQDRHMLEFDAGVQNLGSETRGSTFRAWRYDEFLHIGQVQR